MKIDDRPLIPDDWMKSTWDELEQRIKLKLDLMDAMERVALKASEAAKKQLEEIKKERGQAT